MSLEHEIQRLHADLAWYHQQLVRNDPDGPPRQFIKLGIADAIKEEVLVLLEDHFSDDSLHFCDRIIEE